MRKASRSCISPVQHSFLAIMAINVRCLNHRKESRPRVCAAGTLPRCPSCLQTGLQNLNLEKCEFDVVKYCAIGLKYIYLILYIYAYVTNAACYLCSHLTCGVIEYWLCFSTLLISFIVCCNSVLNKGKKICLHAVSFFSSKMHLMENVLID